MGIRRAQRLKSRSEFAAVYRNGRPVRGRLIALRVLRTNVPASRFGFTVGKALGGAVVRNRIKRRLRELTRQVDTGPGWDIVIHARSGAVQASYSQMADELTDLMRNAGVLA